MTNVQRQRLTSQMLMPSTTFRMLHQRGYNNFDDILAYEHNEITLALGGCKNTENIIAIYKRFGGDDKMTPEQIAHGFWFIAMNGLEKNPDFWNYLIPLVKKSISTCDR